MTILLKEGIDVQKAVNHLSNYKFSAKTTRKFAQNLIKLNASFPDGDKKRSEILTETGNPSESDPRFKEVIEKTNEWLNTTTLEVDFDLISFDELNIGQSERQNHIPPVVLAHLAPMIDFGKE